MAVENEQESGPGGDYPPGCTECRMGNCLARGLATCAFAACTELPTLGAQVHPLEARATGLNYLEAEYRRLWGGFASELAAPDLQWWKPVS